MLRITIVPFLSNLPQPKILRNIFSDLNKNGLVLFLKICRNRYLRQKSLLIQNKEELIL